MHFLDQLNFTDKDHVLDVGCGLGGAARFVASNYGSEVSGIDLTQEYVATGNTLSDWVGLGEKIELVQGSALELPFEDNSFSGAYMLHVGMNVADKTKLFAEVSRVLLAGSRFGVYDIMRQSAGALDYPVPWAEDEQTCALATLVEYTQALADARFEVLTEVNRLDFAMEFFRHQRAKTRAAGRPSPLGLHLLMQRNTAERLQNLVANMKRGLIAPVEIVAKKR